MEKKQLWQADRLRMDDAAVKVSIAQTADMEMNKGVIIHVWRAVRKWQEKGVRQLNELLEDIKEAQGRENVVAKTGIATGYANAMCHFGLISEEELKDVVRIIGQAGEKSLQKFRNFRRCFWFYGGRKGAKA